MKTPKGKLAFQDYYRQFFKDEADFQKFLANLSRKNLPILLFSDYKKQKLFKTFKNANLSFEHVSWYKNAIKWPKEIEFGQIIPGYKENLFYPMSASSLIPVIALYLKSTDKVLDACAAPGGKSLTICNALTSSDQLTCNDLSRNRALRMQKIFRDFGINPQVLTRPAEKLIKFLPKDFDKILLDAPCSSEAHVYRSKIHLDRWSIKRVQKLSHRQIKLILSLLPLLKPGGRLVYSTCAITPEENELVVKKILETSKIPIKLIDLNIDEFKENPGFKVTGIDEKKMIRIMPNDHQMEPIFVAGFDVLETSY